MCRTGCVERVRATFRRCLDRLPYRCHMAPNSEGLRHPRFWQALGVELFGTLFYVLLGSGAWKEVAGDPGSPATLQVALTQGLVYGMFLYTLGHISGCHLNPVVTLAACATRKMCLARALAYIGAQFFGAILGAALALGIAPSFTVSDTISLPLKPGATYIPTYSRISPEKGFVVEFFATFFFLFVITATRDVKSAEGEEKPKVEVKPEEVEVGIHEQPTPPVEEIPELPTLAGVPVRPQRTKKAERTGTATREDMDKMDTIDIEKAEPAAVPQKPVAAKKTDGKSSAKTGMTRDERKEQVEKMIRSELAALTDELPQILAKEKDLHTSLVVGISLVAALLFAVPSSGGGLNPARSLGPAMVMSAWGGHWIYWFGPILGGLAGALTYDIVFAKHASLARVRTCMLANEKKRKKENQRERRESQTKARMQMISQRAAEVAAAEEMTTLLPKDGEAKAKAKAKSDDVSLEMSVK